ncbi:FtsQ-type POTRA domain-containing protein [Thermophilibacter sp. ET337]|uniref:cell division protein FtsQ/DivIB n=1 Tax=Thermophilibacter sp. ET337 TaxID=2973084 RepID=UPI0021AC8DDE|nr:FtsQ-type POTRA domain-containing protein [Thermophilibacter sp. ET337]MCR8907628.1 FtsQ-type POTRA domain-containing protein [Thermophilibacter sp. ET337]
MAKDTSRRPTKRQKTPVNAPGTQKAPAASGSPKPSRPRPAAKLATPKPKPAAKPKKATAPKAKAAVAGKAASSARAIAGKAGVRSLVGKPSAPSTPKERRERHQRGQTLRLLAMIGAGLLALLLVAALALFALRDSSVFSIDSVEVAPTEHVSEEDIRNLVKVPQGSTLLNVDTASIEAALKKDPWVAAVDFERAFPHTLKISIQEQAIDALVVMSSGSIAWYLGDAGTWIQPTSVTSSEDKSINDAALERAIAEGCLLITDVPATVSPVAGSVATDAALIAVQEFREAFSDDFASQIVSYSAPSEDNVSCTLASGVEVLLGSPTDIATKQSLIEKIVSQYPGSLLFINVRVPTEKGVSFRGIDSENVQEGSGVVSSGEDQGLDGEGLDTGQQGLEETGDAAQGEQNQGEQNQGEQDMPAQGEDEGSQE